LSDGSHVPQPTGEEIPSDVLDAAMRVLADTGSAADATLPPGSRLGRFEVLRFLARGGFGAVYEARDTELGRHVAVKLLRAPAAPNRRAPYLDAFRREAATIAQLGHPNLVTLYDYGAFDGHPYLILELLRGRTLAARIVEAPIGVREALDILADVARGLAHAHTHGVVHRDVKPSNVFLCDTGQAKLLDFGLALASDEVLEPTAEPQKPFARAGTRGYMSPEQERGAAQDARSDLFSAGVVLCEMLGCSRADFSSSPRVPDVLRALLERLVAPDPHARFVSADELGAAIASARRALWDTEVQVEQPYRYLEHFVEEDAPWFFGRRAEVTLAVELLYARAIVAVAGASGAGKSSLVRAGVVPRWRARASCVAVMRPGAEPFDRLRACLARAGLISTNIDMASWAARPGALGEALRAHAAETGSGVLVVVDQAEELLTRVADDATRHAFARALAAAADDDEGPVRLLLTVRDDFLGRIAALPGFERPLGAATLFLSAPNDYALAEALLSPAQRVGFDFEAGLCDRIVETLAAQTSPLPLLQLTASRLWERRDLRTQRLTVAALDAQGGVSGVIAAHAEDVFRRLSPADAEHARAILSALVSADGTRRAAPKAALVGASGSPGDAARVLEALVEGRLLTSTRDEGSESVELVHESLVTRWDRLREWLDANRDLRRLVERVEQAALLWEERGHARDLLWRGGMLQDAARVTETPHASLSARGRSFLQGCIERSRRAARRRRFTLWTGVVMLAGTIAALTLGYVASRAAERDARRNGIVSAAAAARDPLAGALLLRELDDPPPRGAAALAFRIAQQALPRAVLRGHKALVNTAAYHPRGHLLASGGSDGWLHLWRADDARKIDSRRVGNHVMKVAFSADGTRLAAASRDRSVYLYEIEPSGRLHDGPVLRGHTGFVFDVAWSHDGRVVVSSGSDSTARIWRADGSGPAHVVRHERPVWSIALSPDGSLVSSGSEDHSVRLTRTKDGSSLWTSRAHRGAVRAVRFSADGRSIVSGSDDGTAIVHDVLSRRSPIVLRGHTQRLLDVAFSPDGHQVATASADRTARVFSATGEGSARVLRGHADQLTSVSFDARGRRILTASDDGTARIWDARADLSPRVLCCHRQGVAGASWRPDGQAAVTFSEDQTLRLWPIAAARDIVRAPSRGIAMFSSFSPDGRLFAETTVEGEVRVFRVGSGEPPRVLRGHEGRGHFVSFDRSGRWLVSASYDRTARVWDLEGRRPPVVLRGHEGPVIIAEPSPDGTLVATGGHDRRVRVFRRDGSGTPRLFRQEAHVESVSFSPDGRFLAAGSTEGGLVFVYDLRAPDGAPVRLRAHEVSAHVELTRDGRRLITAGGDGVIKTWKMNEWSAPERTLQAHAARILRVAVSADSRVVATASDDKTAALSFLEGDRAPIVLRGHRGPVAGIALSEDATRVVTAASDGTVRRWDTATGEETLRVELGGLLDWLSLSPDGSWTGVRSDWGVRHLVRLREWRDLREALGAATRACLSDDERIELLGESSDTARAAAKRCEDRASGGRADPPFDK
jgi:WD40 repeat protein